MVKGVVVVVEVSDKQIKVAVVIVVTNRYAHAALFAAIFVYRSAGKKPDLFKGAVAVIFIEEVRCRVVSYKDINQTIFIEITTDDAHAVVAIRIEHTCFLCDVDKGAVSFVVIKSVAVARQTPRTTLHGHSFVLTQTAFPKLRKILEVEGDVVCHHQIEFAVVVVINKSSASGPTGIRNSGSFRYISKRSVAIIFEKMIRTD